MLPPLPPPLLLSGAEDCTGLSLSSLLLGPCRPLLLRPSLLPPPPLLPLSALGVLLPLLLLSLLLPVGGDASPWLVRLLFGAGVVFSPSSGCCCCLLKRAVAPRASSSRNGTTRVGGAAWCESRARSSMDASCSLERSCKLQVFWGTYGS